MRKLPFLAITLFSAALYAQTDNAVAEMKKVAFLTGNWTGSGLVFTAKGQIPTTTIGSIQSKLGGRALLIETQDRLPGPAGVQSSLALLSFDSRAKQYRMRLFLADGREMDPEVRVGDRRIEWTFSPPGGGSARYTISREQASLKIVGELNAGDGWQIFQETNFKRR